MDDEVAVTPIRDVAATAPRRPSQRLETFIVAGSRFTLRGKYMYISVIKRCLIPEQVGKVVSNSGCQDVSSSSVRDVWKGARIAIQHDHAVRLAISAASRAHSCRGYSYQNNHHARKWRGFHSVCCVRQTKAQATLSQEHHDTAEICHHTVCGKFVSATYEGDTIAQNRRTAKTCIGCLHDWYLCSRCWCKTACTTGSRGAKHNNCSSKTNSIISPLKDRYSGVFIWASQRQTYLFCKIFNGISLQRDICCGYPVTQCTKYTCSRALILRSYFVAMRAGNMLRSIPAQKLPPFIPSESRRRDTDVQYQSGRFQNVSHTS